MHHHSTSLAADTIVAIATPPGRGGIGVVRLSGPSAFTAVAAALTLPHPPSARRATLTRLVDPATGHPIDHAIVTLYPAPHSYTGEQVFEIATHGAPVVLDFLLQQALVNGARLAEPGEFTQRAYLNSRLDLTQAEAVRDLIEANTLHQARLAAQQMGGALSRSLAPIKLNLLSLIAAIEAGIDFAEDDIDVLPAERILASLDQLRTGLQQLADSFHYGRIVHGGFTLAIVGPPNAGKSSLFNRLLDRDRAIVTATPGTTRDLISERLAVAGIPVQLLDTAGLRVTQDEAEQLGIARTREALATADLVLVVTDATAGPSPADEGLVASLQGRPHLLVRNKIDLAQTASYPPPGGATPTHARDASPTNATPASTTSPTASPNTISTSALTGEGIVHLREAIAALIGAGTNLESGLLTNRRQHDAISRSLRAVDAARAAALQSIPHEMVMLNLHAILQPLDELTGTTTPDDVLHLIFSTFCIGK